MSILAVLLYKRFLSGAWPIALVSTDNFSQNGSQLRTSLLTIAKEWQKEGYVQNTFIQYLSNEEIVAFPWTMIDRITPNPSLSVSKMLAKRAFQICRFSKPQKEIILLHLSIQRTSII